VQSTKQNYKGTDIIRTYKSVNTLITIGAHNMWKWLKQITFISASNLYLYIPSYHNTAQNYCNYGNIQSFSSIIKVFAPLESCVAGDGYWQFRTKYQSPTPNPSHEIYQKSKHLNHTAPYVWSFATW